MVLPGSAQDWVAIQNEDASLTWTNVNNGQNITTRNIQQFGFAADEPR